MSRDNRFVLENLGKYYAVWAVVGEYQISDDAGTGVSSNRPVRSKTFLGYLDKDAIRSHLPKTAGDLEKMAESAIPSATPRPTPTSTPLQATQEAIEELRHPTNTPTTL